jgi:hypothetical protein
MINAIYSNNKHLVVAGGNPGGPNISAGSMGAGMIRWNSNTSTMEINDGCVWITMPSSLTSIDLSQETQRVLDWASRKMHEEFELEQKMKQYPALRKAKENLDLIWNVVKDEG